MIFLALLLAWVQAGAPESARAVLDRWRESIEIDRAAEVVDAALPLVAGSGRFARDGEAIAIAARALAAAGERPRAEALLAEARPEEGSRAFVEVERARLALERDDLGAARAILLAEGSVRYPAIPDGWLCSGRVRARSGDLAGAVPLLERFLALAPLDAEAPSAWHMLAQAAIARSDPGTAAELRKKALASAEWQEFYRTRRIQVREHPDDPLPQLGIAELFLAAGAHAKALEVSNAILRRWPDFCRGNEALGRAQRGLGHLAEARAALESAIACEPNAPRVHLELARTLAALGEKEAAATRYARFRELGGTEPLEGR
jgi:tetratricopeptide (TPR) repeat protein